MNPFAPPNLATARTQFETSPGNFLRARRPLSLVRLQTTATTIIATGDEDFEIAQLVAANASAGSTSLTLYLFATGGTAGAANVIANALVMAVNTTSALTWAQGLVIPPNSTLQGLCTANNDVHIFGSGWLVEGGDA